LSTKASKTFENNSAGRIDNYCNFGNSELIMYSRQWVNAKA